MKQNRPAPAYQEYAASMLANYQFRALSPSARGVLYTLRLECWANTRLPSDLDLLSKALGFSKDELSRCLPQLESFFKTEDGWLFSVELDQYRAYLNSIREAQSKGGKEGADKTNSKRKILSKKNDQDPRQVTRNSLAKPSTEKSSTDQSNAVINKEKLNEEWIKEYDDTKYR